MTQKKQNTPRSKPPEISDSMIVRRRIQPECDAGAESGMARNENSNNLNCDRTLSALLRLEKLFKKLDSGEAVG